MNRLRELRKQIGLSVRELDAETGLNFSNLSQIELGRRRVSIRHINVLCDFYHVTADFLLGKSDIGYIVDLPKNHQFIVLSKLEYDNYKQQGLIKEYLEMHQVWRMGNEELQALYEGYDENQIRKDLIKAIKVLSDEQQLKVLKFIEEFLQ